jgi:hypothetical protein
MKRLFQGFLISLLLVSSASAISICQLPTTTSPSLTDLHAIDTAGCGGTIQETTAQILSLAPAYLTVITSTTTVTNPTPVVGTIGQKIVFKLTAQASTATFATPTGTPMDAQMLEFIIKDNGSAQNLSWGSAYVASTIALPTVTTASTPLRVVFQYSTDDSKWHLVGVA